MFGTPLHPISLQRFSSSDRRLSLAAMTYVSSFVRTGSDRLKVLLQLDLLLQLNSPVLFLPQEPQPIPLLAPGGPAQLAAGPFL